MAIKYVSEKHNLSICEIACMHKENENFILRQAIFQGMFLYFWMVLMFLHSQLKCGPVKIINL